MSSMYKFQHLAPRTKILLLVLCAAFVGCLVMMTVPGARAALTYFSDDYVAEIQQTHIGVKLLEQTGTEPDYDVVSGEGALLTNTGALGITEQDPLELDHWYDEKLSARNASDDMDEYVRLTVRKYWANSNGEKEPALDPRLIQLESDDESKGCWVFSEGESTDERLVFYYKDKLAAGSDAKAPAVTAFQVSSDVKTAEQDYSDCYVALAAQVDSVQTSNAPEAAKSAWGVDVEALGLNWTDEG